MSYTYKSLSLDPKNYVSFWGEISGKTSNNYSNDLYAFSRSVISVDLKSLPSDILKFIENGTKFYSSYTAQTSNIVGHELKYQINYNDGKQAVVEDQIFGAIQQGNSVSISTFFAWQSEEPSETTYNVDIRKGSIFSGSVNQNTTQHNDVTNDIKSAYKTDGRIYFNWSSDAGIDNVTNFALKADLPAQVYALDVVARPGSVTSYGGARNIFDGLKFREPEIVPEDVSDADSGDTIQIGSGSSSTYVNKSGIAGTPFISTEHVSSATTLKIFQTGSGDGRLYYPGLFNGQAVPLEVISDGPFQTVYNITADSADSLNNILSVLQFIPSKLSGNVDEPLSVQFSIYDMSDGKQSIFDWSDGKKPIYYGSETLTIKAPTIGGTRTGSVTEAGYASAGVSTATGQLTEISDQADKSFAAVSGGFTSNYNLYSVAADGRWTYTLNNNLSAVQRLNNEEKLVDTFTVMTQDGLSTTVSVTVNGINDSAVISGIKTGVLVEAGGVNNAAVGSGIVTGQLTASDVDSPTTFRVAVVGSKSEGGYGTYSVTDKGLWTYILDNSNVKVQGLNTGDELVDIFPVYTSDGTAQLILLKINGVDDISSIVGDFGGSVVEAGGISLGRADATGQLAVVDPDSSVPSIVPVFNEATEGRYGTYSVNATGKWFYHINNNNNSVQHLQDNESLQDFFTVRLSDKTSQVVSITIYGSSDPALISGDFSSAVTPSGGTQLGSPLATGQLMAVDVDSPAKFQAVQNGTAAHGSFSVSQSGAWSYLLHEGDSEVNELRAGKVIVDTFDVRSYDGTKQKISITINGVDRTAPTVDAVPAIVSSSNATTYVEANTRKFDLTGIYVGKEAAYRAGIVTHEGGTYLEIDNGSFSQRFDLGSGDQALNFDFSSNNTAVALTGGTFGDRLLGGLGDDILDGQAGVDTLVGGLGNDTYAVDNAKDVVTEAADSGIDTVETTLAKYVLGANVENLTYTGSSSLNGTGNALDNVLTGRAGADTLRGGAGNDTLIGNAGNDQLDGGTGEDVMAGGLGNDTYTVDSLGDRIDESGDATGIDQVNSAISFTLGTNLEKLALTGSAAIDGTGNALDNRIVGNGAVNLLHGGDGNDTLLGGAGDDTLYGDAGNDQLDGGTGADAMHGGAGNDTYLVDNVGDTVDETGVGSVDAGGTDKVTLNADAYVLSGGESYTLSAFVENLSLTGTAALDATGNDLANKITGNAGANSLVGGAGNDTLSGLAGNDTLIGGAGNDTLTGGTGADTFVFGPASAASADKVTDFSSAQGDRLEFQAIDFGLGVGQGLNADRTLAEGYFEVVSGKTTAGTQSHGEFLFNTSTKVLSWDADGAGKGAAVAVATFAVPPGTVVADFLKTSDFYFA